MKSKKFNLTVNLIGLALVIFVVVMLFVPYFTYPHVFMQEDPQQKTPAIFGNNLIESLTELRTRVTDDSCSIAHYAFVPTDLLGNGISTHVREDYFPDLTITNGSFAIPVAALLLCALATVILTVIKIFKKVPSIPFFMFGIIGLWAFLSMPPFMLGGAKARAMIVACSILTAGGLAYTVLFLREKTGEVFSIVSNLICAALLIAMIFILFPNSENGTFFTFSTRNAGTSAATNPYLITPKNEDFGTYVYANPTTLLILSLAVLAVSLLRCNAEWPMFLQFAVGVVGMFTILSNPVFNADIPATAGGLAACMFLLAISLVRLTIFSMDRAVKNVAACNYLTCAVFVVIGVLLFTTTWVIGKPNKGGSSKASIAEISMSTSNLYKDDESPVQKAKALSGKINDEVKLNGKYLKDVYPEEEYQKITAKDFAWVGQITMIMLLAGLMMNIILKEKFVSGIINIGLGIGGVMIFAKVRELHYSTNYLTILALFAVAILMGAIILVSTLLGREPAEEEEEDDGVMKEIVAAAR